MVKPMLLQEDNLTTDLLSTEKLIPYVEEKYPDWYYQIKYNGVRGVVSVRDGKITAIRDRNDTPIFQNYPELKEAKFPGVTEGVFDVEVVILDNNGKSHYYNEYDENKKLIQAGIQLRSMSVKSPEIVKKHPVSIVIFDALKLNGELLISKPYKERYAKINLQESNYIKVAEIYTNFKEIWEKVIAEDLEGVVCKNPNSFYEIDARSKNYIKIKNYKLADIEVEKTEINEKGLRVSGKTADNLKVDFQAQGLSVLNTGNIIRIKYLEKIGGVGGRLTQPTVA